MFLSLPLILILVFSSTTQTSAIQRVDVLGESTSSVVEMPATIEGPGLILPDSPFYFMDQLKQRVRVAVAFSPEAKAKVHSDIAGERFAEVRFMLEKDNKKGAAKALAGMAENTEDASKNLDAAKLRGEDTTALARMINEQIKRREEALAEAENHATGEVKANVMVTRVSLDSSKMNVEDHLTDGELRQEIENRLERRVEHSLHEASTSADGLERSIELLSKLSSEAAQKKQLERQEALTQALASKNKERERIIIQKNKEEVMKEKKIVEIKKEEAETARKMVNMANEATIRMEAARKEKELLKSADNAE